MSFPKRNRGKAIQTPWFSEIPEEWETKPIKAALTAVSRPVGDSWSDTTLLSLTQSGIIPRNIESGKGKFPTDFSSYQHVKPDDLIFCLFDIDETPRAVGLSKLDGMVTGAYSVFEANKGNSPGYLSYFFHWIDDGKLLRPFYTGLRKVVRPQTFGAINIPLPPFSEQGQIANFLDRETAKIDALIAEQQRLIELLQEKRQVVISHAVTKGLNPNAPMKDSGVEGLGEVPEHWEVTPLMRLTQPTRPIMYGIVLPGPDVGEGVPILKGGNVKPSRLCLECMARTTPEIEAPFARARLRAGDLVYGIRGSIGDCEIVPIELEGCNITQDVARIAPLINLCSEWLRYAMLSHPVAEGLACGSLGAAVKGINIFDLKRARIPVPPSDEMRHIADFLNSEVSRLLSLSSSAKTTINLLRERRSAIISAAVTGQIDVRGLVPEAAEQ